MDAPTSSTPLSQLLPADRAGATFVGRILTADGPCVVAVRGDELADLTPITPTMADLLERPDAREIAASAFAGRSWALDDPSVRLLAPIDLQVIKAAGVTFAVSMVERVIEERAAGDPPGAQEIRAAGPVRHRRLDRRHRAGQRQGRQGQGGAAGRGAVVAVPGGRHRTRPGDLHQGARAVRRRRRCPGRGAGPLGLEQPRARGGAGRRSRRSSGRGHPRQRRQPARLRGPQRAAARRGQGQQRLLCDRAVHPAVRRRLHPGPTSPPPTCRCGSRAPTTGSS